MSSFPVDECASLDVEDKKLLSIKEERKSIPQSQLDQLPKDIINEKKES
jgi:hypothetical protein